MYGSSCTICGFEVNAVDPNGALVVVVEPNAEVEPNADGCGCCCWGVDVVPNADAGVVVVGLPNALLVVEEPKAEVLPKALPVAAGVVGLVVVEPKADVDGWPNADVPPAGCPNAEPAGAGAPNADVVPNADPVAGLAPNADPPPPLAPPNAEGCPNADPPPAIAAGAVGAVAGAPCPCCCCSCFFLSSLFLSACLTT